MRGKLCAVRVLSIQHFAPIVCTPALLVSPIVHSLVALSYLLPKVSCTVVMGLQMCAQCLHVHHEGVAGRHSFQRRSILQRLRKGALAMGRRSRKTRASVRAKRMLADTQPIFGCKPHDSYGNRGEA